VVLATVGVLTVAMHKLGAFSLGAWLLGAISGSMVLAIVIAAAAIVGAGAFGAQGIRALPKRWGYVTSAGGAGMVAIAIGMKLVGAEPSFAVLPIGFALTALGLGVDAMQSAWSSAKGGSRERWPQAVFFASLAAIAWFLAGEMVRSISLQ
jgi:hypothetical protein